MADGNVVVPGYQIPDTRGDKVTQGYTDDAAHVATQAGSVWSYGDWPNTWWLSIEGTAADTSDGTVVYLSGDVSNYNHHEVSVIAGAGGALRATVSYNGTDFYSTPVMFIDRSAATGSAAQVDDISTLGNYYIEGKFKAFRLIQSGGSISAAYQVRGAHSVK